MSAIGWYRGRRFLVESNFAPATSAKQSSIQNFWSNQTLRNKIFIVVLCLLILGTLGAVGYVISIPKSQDKYSEFYVLDAQGNAENYPSRNILSIENVSQRLQASVLQELSRPNPPQECWKPSKQPVRLFFAHPIPG